MMKCFVLAIATVWTITAPTANAADPIDVQKLVAQKQSWAKWAAQEKSFSVEGRFATRAGKLLRLQKCGLVFRATDGLRLPRLHNGRNVEIIGYFKQVDTKTEFIIQRIAEGEVDLDKFKRLRRRLPKDQAEAWYKLATRIHDRASFYEDAELLAESQSIRDQGFQIERTNIKRGDFKALSDLANRQGEFDLSASLRQGMVHQALRWQWNELKLNKQAKKKDHETFLKSLEKLGGATTPIRLEKKGLPESYKRDPVSAYEKAPLADRLLMHRYFYREVLLPHVLRDLKEDGSNGSEIAKLLRRNIPEEGAMANDLESDQLDFAVKNAVNTSRAEMLSLVNRLERTNQGKLAAETKRRWVVASEQRLIKRGPAGLVQAAMEYDGLLGDRPKAIRLLKRAWAESSEKKEIEDRLAKFDIYRHEDTWLSKEQMDALPENQMEKAIREARVINGMSPEQVRRAVGKPDRVSRFASRSRVQIVWVFGEPTTDRIAVLFERNTGSADDRTRVISVSTLPAK